MQLRNSFEAQTIRLLRTILIDRSSDLTLQHRGRENSGRRPEPDLANEIAAIGPEFPNRHKQGDGTELHPRGERESCYRRHNPARPSRDKYPHTEKNPSAR